MLLALVLVIIAVRADVSLLTALWMLLGGLALQGGSNLLGLAVASRIPLRPFLSNNTHTVEPQPG